MDAVFWKQVNDVFMIAIDLEGEERQKYLDEQLPVNSEVRLKVEQMILADEKKFSGSLFDLPTFLSKERMDNLVGQKIENYRIKRQIGRGGMGVVFEALYESENVSKLIAIKFLRSGNETDLMLKRFSSERQILASLEHPNIVRLLNVGKTNENVPYFTMELVEGETIDDYIEKHNPDLETRLKLFLQICSAVSYAHSKLVIHRDLKPTNIIVTQDGTIKLLDFGIAKILSPDPGEKGTATQFGIMTPRYASPEQIRGETVLVASDVYSLGVILYELLTHTLPYKFTTESPLEIAKIISESEPLKPSKVLADITKENSSTSQIKTLQLKGDLDTIILKALQKESSRRYGSVEQLANDISMYLRGLPISARPDTFGYRVGKFLKRNYLSVGATAVILLAVITGAGIAIWQAATAQRQRALAEKQFNNVQELANQIVSKYDEELAKLQGTTALRENIITDILKYLDALSIEEIANNETKIKVAQAYLKIGEIQAEPRWSNLGKKEEGVLNLEKAANILQKLNQEDTENIEVKYALSYAYTKLGSIKTLQFGTDENAIFEKALQVYYQIEKSGKSDQLRLLIEYTKIKGTQIEVSKIPNTEKIGAIWQLVEFLNRFPEQIDYTRPDIARFYYLLTFYYDELGDEEYEKGNIQLANEYYQKALPVISEAYNFRENQYQKVKNVDTLTRKRNTIQLLGKMLVKTGNVKEGFDKLSEAHQITLEFLKKDPNDVKYLFDLADSHNFLANVYLHTNNSEKFIENSLKSLFYIDQIDSDKKSTDPIILHIKVLNRLIKYFQKTNNTKEIQKYQKQMNELCLSIKFVSACRENTGSN